MTHKRELASRHLYETAHGKPNELAIVSGFLERLRLNLATITECERPDFSLSFGGGRLLVGLELTVLTTDAPRSRGSPERESHSLWKKVAAAIRDHLSKEAEPLPHLYGSVFFRTSTADALRGLDRAKFCEEIVVTLRQTPLSELGSQIADFDRTSTPLLARLVEHMYVRVFPHEDGLLWWSADLQSGVVADPNGAVKAAIAEKQKKARGYQWSDAQERWLLVYAAGEGLADMATILHDPEIENPLPFSQVYLWDRFSETIRCLSPTFALVFEGGNTLYPGHLPPCVRPYLSVSE